MLLAFLSEMVFSLLTAEEGGVFFLELLLKGDERRVSAMIVTTAVGCEDSRVTLNEAYRCWIY